MLPTNVVEMLASREKQVFLSDSEDEKAEADPTPGKKKKNSGLEPVILNHIPPPQCLQSSMEFLKKRKMQVPSMETIRFKKRGGFNVLFEETGSAAGQKVARLKNSISGEEDSKDGLPTSINSSFSNQDFSSLASFSSGSSPSSFRKSPWTSFAANNTLCSSVDEANATPAKELIGSLVREEGHAYSLAVSGDLLYTGSDSKNIRVWLKQKAHGGFTSYGGLVKAIVIAGEKVFTGHRDGKIRVWRVSSRNTRIHRRVGTLPTLKDYFKSSFVPTGFSEVKGCRSGLWQKHSDAISCLCLNEDKTLLYSGSWDKTFKVWRISDWRCLESVRAHDDAVNSIVAGCDGLVFTGSADGSVKVWRREIEGKGTSHLLSRSLFKQEYAITSLALSPDGKFIYCGSSDGVVNFWDCENNISHGGAFRGHKLAILCLVTAGDLLITGSADKTILVWKRCGNQHFLLTRLTGHNGPVKCLAIEKDHESTSSENQWILYSGSLDKSVKLWRITDQTPPAQSPIDTDSSE
ncbi:Extra-large G-protein 1 [Hibiscus syriacus]|uniref:Extra-large G-protein 1 n=1 Tax=Hibiscus syriacus TaxID=106335 RepID=A0A6A3AYE6_HIBSY|nr:Extra-large G-protein 1 [Hibiscus syriacus]